MKVYLAGPSVFYPNTKEISDELKDYCKDMGLIALYPMDNECSGDTPYELAENIAKANIRMIQEADGIIADISCFRGTGMDVGTAFEIGMAVQRGIPVITYTDAPREEYLYRVVREHVQKNLDVTQDEDGVLRDSNKMAIEDFGLQENLMVSCMTQFTDQGAKKALELLYSILHS